MFLRKVTMSKLVLLTNRKIEHKIAPLRTLGSFVFTSVCLEYHSNDNCCIYICHSMGFL